MGTDVTRRCARCGGPVTPDSNGKRSRCRACVGAWSRKAVCKRGHAREPGGGGCYECHLAEYRKAYAADPERFRSRAAEYHRTKQAEDPEYVRRRRERKREYSAEMYAKAKAYDEMLARVSILDPPPTMTA